MAGDEPARRSTQLDARALRALAHPLRVRILELLRVDGPATASGLGNRVGESSGTTSWHLRQLAEVGLVEEDTERGTRRERWWRPVHEADRMRVADFTDDPDLTRPINVYLQSIVEQRYRAESHFVAKAQRWLDRWHDSAHFNDTRLSLRPEEAAALNAEVSAIIERYRRQEKQGDDTVAVHWAVFPRTGRPEQP